jgi:hypothetical protein
MSWGLLVVGQAPASPSPSPPSLLSPLASPSLREWLTVISSDEFEGRATFSAGLDKAAAYISDRLKDAGVRPGGDNGSFLQPVAVQTVQSVNRSTLILEVNGQTRTFRNGEDVFFPANVGAPRTLTFDSVEFMGYGLNAGSLHNDYAGRDVRDKAVVWVGEWAPPSIRPEAAFRLMESRASTALDEMRAAVSIAPAGPNRGRENREPPTFMTTQRLDQPRPVSVTLSAAAMEFLFSASSQGYSELQQKAERLEKLPPSTISGVKLTFNFDADYRVTTTRMTQNIIGIIDGADPQLRQTWVAFGAHYDHLGINTAVRGDSGVDRIYNGADDDGSGSAALIGLAHAFMAGKRPGRSLLFVWHAGEERGLWGSEYLVEHPVVPVDSIVAQLNIDMIGRNRDNRQSEENTVYAVGADRISTELHNILVDTNASLTSPLTLDFEMNDAADPERIYFRSDHFSYAAKGIPIIFFFTGLHPDYHRVTDSVEKIDFEKMSRITRLVYELGMRLANLDHRPARDFKGSRTGRGEKRGQTPIQ